MTNVQTYLDKLSAKLLPLYTPPKGQGGHDNGHVLRMMAMYLEMAELIPRVDRDEYIAAVLLHNIDRYLRNKNAPNSLNTTLYNYLRQSTFSTVEKRRIVLAVKEHHKYKDGEDDSPLLKALRLADKWDRIGILGFLSGFAWLGNERPAYDPEDPFGYGSTVEDGWITIYQNFYRILEWYEDFPLIRELIRRHPWRFIIFLNSVRAFALEAAEGHEVLNEVEADIKKCLGDEYYKNWTPKKTGFLISIKPELTEGVRQ